MPEHCVLYADLNVMASSPSEALSQVSVLAKRVLDALAESGLQAKDVRTTHLAVQDFFDHQKQVVTARVGSYQLEVTIKELDRIGPVIAVMTDAAGDSFQIRSFQLTVRDAGRLREQARTSAVEDARAKAAQIARDAELTLGPIQSIEELTAVGQISHSQAFAAASMPVGRNIIPTVPVEPGTLSVTERVRVTYQLARDP